MAFAGSGYLTPWRPVEKASGQAIQTLSGAISDRQPRWPAKDCTARRSGEPSSKRKAQRCIRACDCPKSKGQADVAKLWLSPWGRCACKPLVWRAECRPSTDAAEPFVPKTLSIWRRSANVWKAPFGMRLARARKIWANDAFWGKGPRPPRSANGTQASAWRGNRSNARSTALKRPYWA